VHDLPKAGSFARLEEQCYDQVWDPVRAIASNTLDYVHCSAPHNKKEQAMCLLHRHDYSVTADFELSTENAAAKDTSDWTHQDRELFHAHMLESNKDFSLVAKRMNKSLNSILLYYYRTYKHRNVYKSMKSKRLVDRQRNDNNSDECKVCNDGGNLICCDSCENAFHLSCIPLRSVPIGVWHCNECKRKQNNFWNYCQSTAA